MFVKAYNDKREYGGINGLTSIVSGFYEHSMGGLFQLQMDIIDHRMWLRLMYY
jgi:hypothetical protein